MLVTSRSSLFTRRAAAAAALLCVGLGGAAAQADETRACLTALDQAQQLRDEGKLKDARAQMLLCARDACPSAIRKDCSGWLAAVEASLPSIVLSAQDASHNDLIGVQVTLDGKPLLSTLDGRALQVDPGPHKLRFETEGQAPLEMTVLIREGEQRRAISAQFPAKGAATAATAGTPASDPTPTPTPTPTLVPVAAIVVGGLGVLGLGSFAFFGVTGKNDLAKLHATCGVTHTCAQGDVDATHNKLLVADISLAAGVVALGVATGLFFASRSHAAPAKAAAVEVGAFPLGKGAGAMIRGSF